MSLRLALSIVAVTAAFVLAAPEPADAQIRASEPAMVMQTVDGTAITIEYYRPRTRGRDHLFGHDAVVWEHIWTPGANWATTIEFERPITIDGHEVAPGKYSLWMEMSEESFLPETLIIEPEPLIFHTQPPAESAAQIRMPIEFESGHPFRDVLTWEFDAIRHDGATLALRWGEHRMAFEVGVEPSMRYTVTEAEAAPMLGVWLMPPPPGVPVPEGMPMATMTVTHLDDGTLRADIEGVPGDDFLNSVDLRLVPFADGIFKPAEFYDGAIQEVWDAFMEAEIRDGAYTGLVLRDEVTDEVFAALRRPEGN